MSAKCKCSNVSNFLAKSVAQVIGDSELIAEAASKGMLILKKETRSSFQNGSIGVVVLEDTFTPWASGGHQFCHLFLRPRNFVRDFF